jgi:hypothetical protein
VSPSVYVIRGVFADTPPGLLPTDMLRKFDTIHFGLQHQHATLVAGARPLPSDLVAEPGPRWPRSSANPGLLSNIHKPFVGPRLHQIHSVTMSLRIVGN